MVFFPPATADVELKKLNQLAAEACARASSWSSVRRVRREQFEGLLRLDVDAAEPVPVVPVTVEEATVHGQVITIGPKLPEGCGVDAILAAVKH